MNSLLAHGVPLIHTLYPVPVSQIQASYTAAPLDLGPVATDNVHAQPSYHTVGHSLTPVGSASIHPSTVLNNNPTTSLLPANFLFHFSSALHPTAAHPTTLHTTVHTTSSPTSHAQALTTAQAVTTAQTLTLDALLTIMPLAASCAAAPVPSECTTAATALPHINAAFAKYQVTHPAVRAALLATMAFESSSLRYNRNHVPGTPGQGTKAMLMPQWIRKFALALGKSVEGDADAVLARVQGVDATFEAAVWFLVTHCGPGVREGLWGGMQAGWMAYVSGCLGAVDAEERTEFWQRGLRVLGSA